MYLTADSLTRRARGGRGATVAGNVVALGAVSLVTDVSSEMVTAVLPLYLVLGLGLSPLQFGFLDGLYGGVTAIVRLAGGHAADRWQRRKLVAGVGYALSAGCKVGLLLAGSSVAALGTVLAADRTGKGIRTAPRDALIAASAPPADLGHAFGVHRAMDTAGALLGPLAAVALLSTSDGRYDTVFVTSFCVAVLGVLLLVLFVRDRPAVAMPPAPRLAAFTPPLRRACLVAALLGVVTIGDAFVYLLLNARVHLATEVFPLLPVGTAVGFLALSVPFGRLADRYGRRAVFLAGHLALLGVYALLLGPLTGVGLLVTVLGLHGAFYAATDGVLMALVAPTLPAGAAATGLAYVQTAQAVARLGSGVLIGAGWTLLGPNAAVGAAMAGLSLALGGAASVLRRDNP
jgi:MFS family permease